MILSHYARRLVSGIFVLATASHLARAQQPSSGGSDAINQGGEVAPAAVIPRPTPAKPPHVSCQGGQLTIVAANSTMSSIFSAIHACIGVDIQVPKGFDDDRTFITLGPAPAREVLNDFLSGTDFDYVIQSSTSDTRKIQSIQVTARTKDVRDGKEVLAAANLTMTPARRLWLASRNAGRPATDPDDNAAATDGGEPSVQATDSSPSAPADSGASVAGITAAPDSKDQPGDQKQDQPKDQSQGNSGVTAPSANTQPGTSSGTTAVTAPSPDSSDANQTAPPSSVLQKQINQMEQLFEQRKQMIAKPAPAQTPDPNQN